MNITISIVIPTYNRAHTLPVAVQSVLEQSAPNWELIVVDDGSTDETREVVRNYFVDKRVSYYYQKHAGVTSARNRGIARSTGEYIIFLDSDDYLLPDLISRLNSVELKNHDLIFWQVKKIFKDKVTLWKPKRLEKIYNNITASFLAGSVCYKKSLLLKTGGFDEELQFGENYELGMRIAQIKKLRYKLLESPYLIYRVKNVRENSRPSKKIKSLKYLLNKHKDLYAKDPLSHSRLLYQLGFLSEKLSQKKAAKKYYQKAVKTRLFYPKALVKLAIAAFKGL